MKSLIAILLLCGFGLQVTMATAQPVLVTVDLNNHEQVRAWRALNIPTYEFIGRTAIAEMDDAAIGAVSVQGFAVEVIDPSPWTADYYVGSVHEPGAVLPGRIILAKAPAASICCVSKPTVRVRSGR